MWKKATLRSALATACACAAVVGTVGPVPRARRVLRPDPGGDQGRRRTIPDQLDPGGNRDPDTVTTCYWPNYPKGSVSLWSKVSPDEPKGLALKQLLDKGRKARAVPGLGDDAVFMENPSGGPGERSSCGWAIGGS